MNNNNSISQGVNFWLEQNYSSAVDRLLEGITNFTSIQINEFLSAGTTPSRVLLELVCNSINEGEILIKKCNKLTENIFPHENDKIGWMLTLQYILYELTVSNWFFCKNSIDVILCE